MSALDAATVERAVTTFIVDNFLFGQQDRPLGNSDSFLESGVIDSTGVLELIAFLESRYGISIDDEELVPANLDSIDRVSGFVDRKLKMKGADVV